MQLNHIDLQVPDVTEAAAFFERWFGFTWEGNRASPAIAILRGEGGFVLVLQRRKEGEAFPEGFHVGFLVPDEDAVVAFQRRARAAGLEISDVLRNGRGTLSYCQAPGGVLVEVSCPSARLGGPR
jgi:catechol 2,3-dioxygenase-like lactoylglutathione lyase family enzyme